MKNGFLKAITFAAMFSFLFVLATTTSSSAAAITKRLSGQNRYLTSIAVSTEGWQQSEYAILVTGENFPDALGATTLSKKYNCPILLTSKGSLSTELENELARLGVRQVIMLGGYSVISENVENQLQSKGIAVNRLAGQDRYETAVKIAEAVGVNNEIIVTVGTDFGDALAIAPIAAMKGIPILLVSKNDISETVKNFINGNAISKSYVIGDASVISDAVAAQLPNVERITGKDKFERNLQIINRFAGELNFNTLYLVSGRDFPDSLSGSALVAENNAAIVLVNKNTLKKAADLGKNKAVKNYVVIGGQGAVASSDVTTITGTSDSVTNVPDTNTESAKYIKDIEVSPKLARPSDQVTIKLTATDIVSKNNTFVVSFRSSPTKNMKDVTLNYDSTAKVWVGQYNVLFSDASGMYNDFSVTMSSRESNQSYKGGLSKVLVDKATFAVTNNGDSRYNNANYYNNYNQDTQPPRVIDMEISNKTVNVGDKISIQATVVDDIVGVGFVYVSFNNPSRTKTQDVFLQYDSNANLWVGEYQIQSTDESGIYSEFNVSMSDNVGNKAEKVQLTSSVLSKMKFTVTNTVWDTEAPKIVGISVLPKTVHIGEKVRIKAELTDNMSGINIAYVMLKNPSGITTKNTMLSYDSSSNLWVGEFTMQTSDEIGSYSDFFISITDKANNQSTGWDLLDNFRSKTTFSLLTNNTADIQPPKLLTIETTPKTVNVGEKVTVKALVTDDLSGVGSVSVSFKNPSKTKTQDIVLTYGKTTNYWIGSYTIQSTDESGVWGDCIVTVTDNAGNQVSGGDIFNSFNGNGSFTVSNAGSWALQTQKILDITTTPNTGVVGTRITIKVDIASTIPNINSAYIRYKKPTGNLTVDVPLTYNASTHLWVGQYIVQYNDTVGVYSESSINILDGDGNQLYGGLLLNSLKEKAKFTITNNGVVSF